jgi:hypothetical protein
MIRGVTANDDAQRTPLDQALDLLVYLPVGLAFELPRAIPEFIERGRRELHAEGHGVPDLARFDPLRKLDRAQAHAVGTLRALGVLPPAGPGVGDDGGWAPGPDGDGEPVPPDASADPAAEPVAPAGAEPVAVAVDGGDPDALAIPAYDSLSASQVMPRLESLAADELELVRTYEMANRGRKTILNKIAQLQAS